MAVEVEMMFLSRVGRGLDPYLTANKRILLQHSVLEIQQGLSRSGLLKRLNRPRPQSRRHLGAGHLPYVSA